MPRTGMAALLALLGLLGTGALAAQGLTSGAAVQLLLKDGAVVQATVLGVDAGSVALQRSDGKGAEIAFADIQSITSQDGAKISFPGSHGDEAAPSVAPAAVPAAVPTAGPSTWLPALVPGWQQFRRGDKLGGALFAAGFVASLGAAVYFDLAGDQSYAAYKSATTASDARNLYDQTTSQDTLYTAFAYTAIGVYALNVVDALLFDNAGDGPAQAARAHPWEPQVAIRVSPQGMEQVTLGWRL